MKRFRQNNVNRVVEEGDKMLRLKSCPRCRGDVVIDRDLDGWYEQCLQCGYQRYLENLTRAPQPVKKEGKVAVYASKRK